MWHVQTQSNMDRQPSASRECFSHDPRVNLSVSSYCSHYIDTGFVKGQLVPTSGCAFVCMYVLGVRDLIDYGD